MAGEDTRTRATCTNAHAPQGSTTQLTASIGSARRSDGRQRNRSNRMHDVLRWLAKNHESMVRDLAELVAVPSVSTDGQHQREIATSAQLVADQMRRAGLQNVRLL